MRKGQSWWWLLHGLANQAYLDGRQGDTPISVCPHHVVSAFALRKILLFIEDRLQNSDETNSCKKVLNLRKKRSLYKNMERGPIYTDRFNYY